MADPVTKKIDTLADLSGIAASGDKMVVIDASDTDPVTKTKLVAMNQLSIHTATQLAANVVESAQIKDGAVTPAKTSFAPSTTTLNGVARFSNTTGGIKDTSTFKISDNGQITTTTTVSPTMYLDGMDSLNTHYSLVCRDGAGNNTFWVRNDGKSWVKSDLDVTTNLGVGGNLNVIGNISVTGNLSVTGEITGAKHVVYMQLFLPDEAIITASGRSQFFVPSYLAGGKVKQLGIGIVSASTPSVSVALGSSYGSVSGTSSTETADTLNYTLPSARTKIPINVTCGAGTAPKGLDFWFVVLK